MRLKIKRAHLIRALGHAQSIIEKRNTIPVLSNVLIEAADSRVLLKATDLDIEIIEIAQAQVDTSGSTTIPAHLCYEIVRKFPEDTMVELHLDGDKSTISMRGGHAHFMLQTLPVENFSDLGSDTGSHNFTTSGSDMKYLLNKARFAMSSESMRHYLNGIYLHRVDAGDAAMLRAVATDGHRLAQIEIPAPEGTEGMPGVIIPRKTVNELSKLLDGYDSNVTVNLSSSKIRFSLDSVTLTSKLVDGTFPDYEHVIPKSNEITYQIDKHYFSNAVDRVATISDERGGAVKLCLQQNKLNLSVNNPESGNANEDLDVDYVGTPLEIGFNARYLLNVAGQLDREIMRIELSDPGSPAVIRDPGEYGSALYVIMPMRV